MQCQNTYTLSATEILQTCACVCVCVSESVRMCVCLHAYLGVGIMRYASVRPIHWADIDRHVVHCQIF